MAEIISLAILGIVQGLTEFLPVSSTGHLILAREFFGFGSIGFGLAEDAVLHLATALAVLVYFRSDIWQLICGAVRALQERSWNTHMTLVTALVVGTVPAVVFGLWLESSIETVFRSALVVAGALVLGSVVMLAAEYVHHRQREKTSSVSVKTGLGIGFFQALALIPGMSRSGMSISGGMLFGLSRLEATRFAFLLSFPVILGAGGIKLFELLQVGGEHVTLFPIVIGSLTAFASGMFAIHFLISFLKTNTLVPFVIYRLLLAGIILILVL